MQADAVTSKKGGCNRQCAACVQTAPQVRLMSNLG